MHCLVCKAHGSELFFKMLTSIVWIRPFLMVMKLWSDPLCLEIIHIRVWVTLSDPGMICVVLCKGALDVTIVAFTLHEALPGRSHGEFLDHHFCTLLPMDAFPADVVEHLEHVSLLDK